MIRSLIVGVVLGCLGCGEQPAVAPGAAGAKPEKNDSVVVIATSYAVYEMASEVAGDACKVVFPATGAPAPHDWKPTADEIRQLQSADVVLLNGAGYEPWVSKVSLPRSRTVETSSVFEDRLRRVPEGISHQHGPKGEDSGGVLAWAVWMDPVLAGNQLKAVENALSRAVPQQRSAFAKRAQLIAERLSELERELNQISGRTKDLNLTVWTAGPYYEYLTARLDWESRILAAKPNATEISELLQGSEKNSSSQIRVLLHDAKFDQSSRSQLAEDGVVLVEVDICEQPIPARSLWSRMSDNIERLEQALPSTQQERVGTTD